MFFYVLTTTTFFYTLSLHDALPIFLALLLLGGRVRLAAVTRHAGELLALLLDESDLLVGLGADLIGLGLLEKKRKELDRKSTRLNSSHSQISYAVFCLKKKKHPVVL